MATDERHFAADARYAASARSGVRWHDPRTGQESFSLNVDVQDLLDAGADPQAPDEVKLPTLAKIGPYQPPEPSWKGSVSWARLDPKHDGDGKIVGVYTRRAVESEVFDDRDDAVEWVSERVDAFETAPQKDARDRPSRDG